MPSPKLWIEAIRCARSPSVWGSARSRFTHGRGPVPELHVARFGLGQSLLGAPRDRHPLDILDRIGIAAPMKAEGRQIQKFAFRDRDRMIGAFRFDKLPSQHNYLLMLPQDRTEAIMLAKLADLGVEVVRGATFTSLREETDRVVVELQTPEGAASHSGREAESRT